MGEYLELSTKYSIEELISKTRNILNKSIGRWTYTCFKRQVQSVEKTFINLSKKSTSNWRLEFLLTINEALFEISKILQNPMMWWDVRCNVLVAGLFLGKVA